ncbi:protein phosphatase 2C domain-containing protein [Halobellus clavatus]|uniref:Protein phosphatase 2C n=1 Tax=Halobellus clavatus TaxID=660517 RepID=A0A1H3I0J1_9EURY|nr:protein phosphatase 2C domain-containing protein [Halobellus clavatus]SDY20629.1 Protein phosphatase 2C [Halobellus clavatus]
MPRIETIRDAGGSVCEDLVRTTAGAAWVLDGTSGFGDRSFTDAASDGRWYVETLDAALRSRIDRDGPLDALLEASIADTAEDLAQCVPDSADSSLETAVKRYELPACTASVLRWDDDRIEYLTLCDASTLYRRSDGGTERITSPGILDEIDAETQRRRNLARAGGETTDRDVRAYIRETRQYANTPGGYWVAQTNPLAARFATDGTIERTEVDAVVLHSDGLDPIVEVHDALTDWGAVLSAAISEGAEAVVEELRRAESALPKSASTGVRTGDDVALALVGFTE